MEYFHSQVPCRTTGTLHLDGRHNISKRSIPFEAPTATPGWHAWAVEIEPVAAGVQFTFLLEGTPYHSYTDTQHRWRPYESRVGKECVCTGRSRWPTYH